MEELFKTLLLHLEQSIGPVGAVFCVFTIFLYLDNRSINKDLRSSIPKRVEADTLIQTTLARMVNILEKK